jgi:hypothetical protein
VTKICIGLVTMEQLQESGVQTHYTDTKTFSFKSAYDVPGNDAATYILKPN